MADTAFLTDVKTLRARARKSLDDGAVTPNYEGDVEKAIELASRRGDRARLHSALHNAFDRRRWNYKRKCRGRIRTGIPVSAA
jgi:hypothetical protein